MDEFLQSQNKMFSDESGSRGWWLKSSARLCYRVCARKVDILYSACADITQGVQAQFKSSQLTSFGFDHLLMSWIDNITIIFFFLSEIHIAVLDQVIFHIHINLSLLTRCKLCTCVTLFISACFFNNRQMVVWRAVCCGCWIILALHLGGDGWGNGLASP